MNDIFNEQKEILLSIKKEISLLHQQVDYLIRNEQPLGLLDLDVLMNRTHTLYDKLCSINLGSEENEELPVGEKEIRKLFGVESEEEDEEVESGEEEEEDEISEENESAYFIEDIDDVADEETQPETVTEPEHNSSDDLGFILNFEPVSEEPQPSETPAEEVKQEPSVFTSGDEIEMEVKREELEERSKEEEEAKSEEEIVYEPVVIGDMTDHDDAGFELEQPETVGERYQQGQEETVGERLQHSSVRDLQSAIGINDKFLFVNELFGGSMEKYNRSIENLNDLKTLNGALIYLNELRIELQWNSSNEAYKKLLELVHRKFES